MQSLISVTETFTEHRRCYSKDCQFIYMVRWSNYARYYIVDLSDETFILHYLTEKLYPAFVMHTAASII